VTATGERPDCVAIITARGGSKRLPDKNIKPLGGKPLIAWSVAAALGATSIRRTIVSTDDARIGDAARAAGAEVPFERPAELATDGAGHLEVLRHAIDWLEQDEGRCPELICLLQPTSPLRLAEDIDGAVAVQLSTGADCVVSMCKVSKHPAIMYQLDASGAAAAFYSGDSGKFRSQDYLDLYYLNGAIYVLRTDAFRARNRVLSDAPQAYVMPAERSVDIDDELDFVVAEALVARTATAG